MRKLHTPDEPVKNSRALEDHEHPDLATHRILATCGSAHGILSRYYGFSEQPNFSLFLLPPHESLGRGGTVYCQESSHSDEVYLGLQFGTLLAQEMGNVGGELTSHALAVIAEETSHLQGLIDACSADRSISILNLEVLGEIDRFLTLLHWNALRPERPLNQTWRNLHDVCDALFAGDRFPPNPLPLYLDAESIALGHLQKAFARTWDCSHFDFASVNRDAARYLTEVRRAFFRPLQQLAKAS